MSNVLIGGIEGGATHSHAVIMNSDGIILAHASGPATNHHLVGMKECQKRIAELIDRTKIAAEIPVDTPLHGLGLSLSGCEQEETNQKLALGLKEHYPNLSQKCIICSDTEGSIAATSNNGGITCIAGTGSNTLLINPDRSKTQCGGWGYLLADEGSDRQLYFTTGTNTLLINPDRSKTQCGGWGYLLADEGSAFKISHRAVKYCFDDLDNFEKAPFSIDRVWHLVKEHFKIKTQADILDSFYKDFEKAHIASLCKKLGELARDGDELALCIFSEAGTHLARNINAVVPKVAPELINKEGGIHVLCVGSVWLSWDLLRSGFVNWIENNTKIEEMSLMRLKTEMGVGAALLASDRLNLPLDRDYSKNYTIFYSYKRGVSTINNGSA